MNRPRSRAAWQKEEKHMKKWMALLLCGLLCWCAAGAMAEGTAEIVLSHFDSWTYDIYPNGYTKTGPVTTEFIEHEGPYVIKGDSGPKDTPLEFHANAYDEATGKAKTENGQNASYDVTFDSLELIPSTYSTAIRFGCNEGQATDCSITLKLRLSGTSEIWTFGHPAFQYAFTEEGNAVKICVHNSDGSLTLGANSEDEKLVGKNITLYANSLKITNTSEENKAQMTVDAKNFDPTSLIRKETSPATCTSEGISQQHWECPNCGALFTDAEGLYDTTLSAVTIPALGHDLTPVPAKEPTCEQDGNIEHWVCSRCGELFTDADGKNETTLNDVTLLALGHALTLVPAKEPTYAQDGNIEHWVCSRCGELFADANGTQELTPDDVVLPMLVRTDTLPQTGDSSRLTLWLTLLGACCAGLWCVSRRRG